MRRGMDLRKPLAAEFSGNPLLETHTDDDVEMIYLRQRCFDEELVAAMRRVEFADN